MFHAGGAINWTKLNCGVVTKAKLNMVCIKDVEVKFKTVLVHLTDSLRAPIWIVPMSATVSHNSVKSHIWKLGMPRVCACGLHFEAISTSTSRATNIQLTLACCTLAVWARLALVWNLHGLSRRHNSPIRQTGHHVEPASTTASLRPCELCGRCRVPFHIRSGFMKEDSRHGKHAGHGGELATRV